MLTEPQLKTVRLRLVLRSADFALRADDDGDRRYSASFDGPEPTIHDNDHTVTIEYPRFRGGLPFRPSRGEVRLNPSFAWEIYVDGGVSNLAADLGALPLRSFEIAGGASDVHVVLPEPTAVIPVRIRGGASKVSFRRAADVPARLWIAGGASKLTFDEERFGAVGGETRLASAGADDAAGRYDIEVEGGASRLTVAASDDD